MDDLNLEEKTGRLLVSSKIDHRRLARLRRGHGEIANHVIDEFFAGHISRREFVRAGSVVGLSLPLLSFLAACGGKVCPPSGSLFARSMT